MKRLPLEWPCLALTLALAGPISAAVAGDVAELLSRPILAANQTLAETRAFCAERVAPLPAVADRAAWEKQAQALRQRILGQVVLRGAAADWATGPVRVEWLDAIEGGPGYSIRKLRYEAVPGLWIPALLYEPQNLAGKAPVFLNVNGHDPNGKAADYKQLRCINLAKRGILALNPEWFGMGQLRAEDYAHGRMNQLDLCGTSGLAPFYLAMKRGLDLLLDLPGADPDRVGVAGLSGGGWQTIVISSLDTRVTLSNPVAGYSSFITRGNNFSDLGDSEQTPVDLAAVADYSHLTALLAPRAALLTYNLNDNCCFKADHALPPLLAAGRPVYALFGKPDHLRYHVNADPGDHNFQQENREALYQMVARHFFGSDSLSAMAEIPSAAEIKSAQDLHVEVPAGNANFNSLARLLARGLPRNAALPKQRDQAERWQAAQRAALAGVTKFQHDRAQAEMLGEAELAGTRARFWAVKLARGYTVPVAELWREQPQSTVMVAADGGRAQAAGRVADLLARGARVLAVDPFYLGEAGISQRAYLWALLVSSVGERPLGLQAGQLASVAAWASAERGWGPVRLLADGPRVSLAALVASALAEGAVSELETHGALGSLAEVIHKNQRVDEAPELFCFGLLEAFDILQIAALSAPRPVSFHAITDQARSQLLPLAAWYRLWQSAFDPFAP